MRSIGKVKLKKLFQIVDDVSKKELNSSEIFKNVLAQVPEAWYYTWESAQNEIERAIWDRIFGNRFRK